MKYIKRIAHFATASIICIMSIASASSITHALGIEADSLDPHRFTSGGATGAVFHLFDRLVELRIEPEVHIVPGLATDWSVSEDGLTWIFNLREDVKFHDDTPVDAEAVAYNFRRILDPEEAASVYGDFAGILESVEVIDSHTVQFNLSAAYAAFLNLLTISNASILSPTALEASGEDFAFNPVGSGPFVFESWVRDERMVLRANQHYWDGVPQIETLTYIPVLESSTRLIMLERGEVDAIPGIPIELLPRIESNSELTLLNVPSARSRLIGINTLVEPLDDVRVRQALNYAIDLESINEILLSGTKRLSDSPLPPTDFGYKSTFYYEYDPEKAVELLTEAGYPDGFTVNLVILLQTRDAGLADVLQAVRDYWNDIGVETTVTSVEIAAYSDIVNSEPDSDNAVNLKHVYAQGLNSNTMDADYTLRSSFHCDSRAPVGNNRGYFCDSTIDALIDQAAGTMDPDERQELYAEAQELIMEAAPWVFQYVEPLLFGVRSDIEGIITYPQDVLLYRDAYRVSEQ